MSEKNEVNNNVEEVKNEEVFPEIEVKESKARKVIKYVLTGLAFVATAIAGALVGHSIGKDDDGDDDTTGDTETNE